MGRYYNFHRLKLVHIGTGAGRIESIQGSLLDYTGDDGVRTTISLTECARIYRLLREAQAFPPQDADDWGVLASVSDFDSLDLTAQPVVGLRGAADDPPWFQFLDIGRTQFEFKSYDHIQDALLRPLARAGRWYTWDAS